MRPTHVLVATAMVAVLASCGSSSASFSASASTSPARVTVEGGAASSANAGEPRADLPPVSADAWPTDSGLPGADQERVRVPADGRPSRGGLKPLVTIVIFSDFECPFCSRVVPTLAQIEETFGEDVRMVFRNNPLPFHQNAQPAAQAAMEAYAQGGDDAFWRMHDVLFDNQRALFPLSLEGYAGEVGLDTSAFRSALAQSSHDAEIADDVALAQRAGARGTPNFFINGRSLRGAQPFESFATIIREEIAIAQEAIDRGLARERVYEAVLAASVETPAPDTAPPPTRAPRRVVDPAAVHHVPVGSSPAQGPANALVTVVAFSDFQCPFCARVQSTLETLRQRYGQDLRIVFKHHPLPFHPRAPAAHRAAIEARSQRGDAGFWRMHDLLFENYRNLEDQDLEGYAQQLGLRMPPFRRAIRIPAVPPEVAEDTELAESLGASGTPNFFINGRYLAGAQPVGAFTAVIDEELGKARELVAAGTPRRQLYARIIDGAPTTLVRIDAPSAPGAGAAAAPAPPVDQVYTIPIPSSAPTRGRANAPVTIQIFSDFQCPFCSRVLPTIEAIEREYGRRIRLVWRHYPLPFHQDARPAHRAAIEVQRQGGDRKFWAFHDLLFMNQRALGRDDLLGYARRVAGIDVRRVAAVLDGNQHDDVIEADMDAITDAGARIGTPSFFINGRLLQGAQPIERFREAIDRALSEAAP